MTQLEPADRKIATEQARWTVAAFLSNPDAKHEELVELLSAVGMPHADHAVAILPIAFGRQLLEGLVTLPASYHIGDREIAYSDDPIFVAARELAAAASRREIELIGLRSAEVHAVNQALNAGSQPADLVVATVFMPASPEVTPRPIPSIANVVEQLAHSHGGQLDLEAHVFPKQVLRDRVMLQLDLVTRYDGREIRESFAGLGGTILDALKNALQKFTDATLHVLIATIGGGERDGHVDRASWRNFEMCSGPLLRQWSDEPPLDFAALADAVRSALPALSVDLHWFSLFVAVDKGKPIAIEAQLDNASCAPVKELLVGWAWPHADKAYALRHFFMLVPAGGRA